MAELSRKGFKQVFDYFQSKLKHYYSNAIKSNDQALIKRIKDLVGGYEDNRQSSKKK